jgi:hypothetical protein
MIFDSMTSKIWKVIYTAFSFIGMLLLICGVELYNLTFIHPFWLILLIVIPTIPLYIIIRKHYSILYGTSGFLFPLMQSLFSAGFTIVSLFLIMNYHLANTNEKSRVYDIETTGKLGGKHHKPYAVIKKGSRTKKLVFKRNPTILPDDQIRLVTAKGFFGFEVILKQEVVR